MPSDPGGDDDDPRCGSTETHDSTPCHNKVGDPEDTCWLHGPDGEIPEGQGSGSPDHTMGSGQPPEGNKNAMTHGVYASKNDPWGTLEWLEEHEPQVYARVVRWFWDDAQRAPFDVYQDGGMPDLPDDVDSADGVPGIDVSRLTADAADLFLVNLDRGVTFRATMSQVRDGLVTTQKRQNSDGDYVDVVDENPANMPKNRMRREDRAQLKDLGLRDDSPDAVAAQGQADMASAAERVAQLKDQAGSDGGDA